MHINLFVSFVLRALLALMRDNLMAEGGLGLPQDLSITENGTILFDSEGSVSFSDSTELIVVMSHRIGVNRKSSYIFKMAKH